ncbi:MAG: hypothetical protein LC791_17660 [Acidobacteria bacterium]|nr:hypothetical protein [Acidobacteriota bacterium]
MLYGIGTLDGITFGAAVLVLVVVALAAGAIPARRVAGIEPSTALRTD